MQGYTLRYLDDKSYIYLSPQFFFAGEQVYGLMWDGMSRRIVVLHEKGNKRRITMYGIDYWKWNFVSNCLQNIVNFRADNIKSLRFQWVDVSQTVQEIHVCVTILTLQLKY